MKKIGLALLVAAAAPSAFAVGTYTEIWNPPEARLVKPPVSGKRKPGKVSLLSRSTPKATPRQVADPVAKSPPSARAGASPTKPMTPQPTNIPRIITPEGNVLRVNHGDTPVRMIR